MDLKLISGGLFFLAVLDLTRCFLIDSPNSTFTALTSKEFDQLLDLVMQEQKSRYNLEHYVGILENKYHELETKFHDLSVANAGLLSSNKVLESMNRNLSMTLTAKTDMLERDLRNQSMSTARLDKVISENAVKMNASIEHLLQSSSNRNVSGFEIGFTASQPRTISSATMIFSNVITNTENLYNNITGEFTCNRPGLYYFALSLSKARTSGRVYDQISCHIRKNRNNMIRAWLDPTDDTTDAGGYETSNFLLLHLNVGDIVDVGNCQHDTPAYGADSSFTGFLVD